MSPSQIPALPVLALLDLDQEAAGRVGDVQRPAHRHRLDVQGVPVLLLQADGDGEGLGVGAVVLQWAVVLGDVIACSVLQCESKAPACVHGSSVGVWESSSSE
jgi:hypothetical protein